MGASHTCRRICFNDPRFEGVGTAAGCVWAILAKDPSHCKQSSAVCGRLLSVRPFFLLKILGFYKGLKGIPVYIHLSFQLREELSVESDHLRRSPEERAEYQL